MKHYSQLFLNKLFSIFFASGFIIFFACQSNTQNKVEPLLENTHPIELANFKVSLPEGEGKNYVEANCMICHSLQYIMMQPELTEKQWEKTVDKMIVSFGAPVADSVARVAIIKYLVNIRGTKK